MHTEADENRAVSIENLHRVFACLAGIHIRKLLVDFEGGSLRGNVERYEDHAIIHVRLSQSDYWQRFTVVKELCHVLLDEKEDWSTDVVETISGLLAFTGLNGEESAPIRSEKLAEVMALELVYPLEYRAEDRAYIEAGGKVTEVSDNRKVPPLWVERALKPHYMEMCEEAWKLLREVPAEEGDLPDEPPKPLHLK